MTRSYIICQRIQNNKHSSHNTICLLDNRLCIDMALSTVWFVYAPPTVFRIVMLYRQSSAGHRLALRSLPQKRLECSRPHRGRPCSTWRCPLASVEYVGSTSLSSSQWGVEHNPGSFSFGIRHNCGRQTFADPQPLSSLLVLW